MCNRSGMASGRCGYGSCRSEGGMPRKKGIHIIQIVKEPIEDTPVEGYVGI